MHSLYERFYKGQLDFFDVCNEYEDKYSSNITLKFPKNAYADLNKKYYQSGLNALETFDNIPENYEILDIECKIDTLINDIRFIGYADLILRNKDTHDIIIVDHKSKAKFSSKSEQKKYARQLYLYSVYVKEHYGKYPAYLVFNMFRVGQIVKIDFKESELKEAISWFTNTVSEIYFDLEFIDKHEILGKDLSEFSKQDFFCNELCGVRKYCPRSNLFKDV